MLHRLFPILALLSLCLCFDMKWVNDLKGIPVDNLPQFNKEYQQRYNGKTVFVECYMPMCGPC